MKATRVLISHIRRNEVDKGPQALRLWTALMSRPAGCLVSSSAKPVLYLCICSCCSCSSRNKTTTSCFVFLPTRKKICWIYCVKSVQDTTVQSLPKGYLADVLRLNKYKNSHFVSPPSVQHNVSGISTKAPFVKAGTSTLDEPIQMRPVFSFEKSIRSSKRFSSITWLAEMRRRRVNSSPTCTLEGDEIQSAFKGEVLPGIRLGGTY